MGRLLVMLTLLALLACNNNNDDDSAPVVQPPPSGETPAAEFPLLGIDGERIDFQMMLDNVLTSKCLNCHSPATGNQGGLNYADYDNVYRDIEKIRDSVATDRMPKAPGPALSAAEKEFILKWIAAGASEIAIPLITENPGNSGNSGPPPDVGDGDLPVDDGPSVPDREENPPPPEPAP